MLVEKCGAGYERLPPSGEFGKIFAAVGNNELKALTIAVMKYGQIYTATELWQKVLEVQGSNPVWEMARSVPIGFAIRDFEKAGLVTKKTDGLTGGVSVSLSEKGHTWGKAIAGQVMRLSSEYGQPLTYLFSNSQSHKFYKKGELPTGNEVDRKSGTEIRIKILKCIVKLRKQGMQKIGEKEIVEDIHEQRNPIGKHLKQLASHGYLSYRSEREDGAVMGYSFNPESPEGNPQGYKRHDGQPGKLTQRVYEVLKNNISGRDLTSREVAEILSGEEGKLGHSFLNLVHNIMKYLADNKYLLQTTQTFSEVILTDDQFRQLADVASIIDGLETWQYETMKAGRDYAEETVLGEKTERVRQLVENAKKGSSNVNRRTKEKTREMVESIIAAKPDGVTADQIRLEMVKRGAVNISEGYIVKIIRGLRKEGSVELTGGEKFRYFPKSNVVFPQTGKD